MAVVATGRVVALTSACQLHDAREGTGYENAVGMTVDEFRAVTPVMQLVIKTVPSDDVPPGRIARVSRCGAPRYGLIVSVARS